MILIHFVSHTVFFFKLTFLKKTLWYHLRKLLNGSFHTLFKASGPKTHPVQNAKKIIVKLYTMFKNQEPKNHTLFSGTYILYTCLGQISFPFSGVCSWYTAFLWSRNHVEVKKPAQSVRPVTVVIVYYMYESYNIWSFHELGRETSTMTKIISTSVIAEYTTGTTSWCLQ